jgi:hypothetical protein
MTEGHAARQETTIRQLPGEADQQGEKRLDLMPIRETRDADIMKRDREIVALANAQRNTFIADRAVALQPAQGLAERLGGRRDIIEEPHLANIEALGEVKAKKIVLQCVCDEFDKSDLTLHREPNAIVFDLLTRYTSLRHQRRHVNPRRSRPSRGEPRQRAGGIWDRTEPLETGLALHICHSRRPFAAWRRDANLERRAAKPTPTIHCSKAPG